jgi:hypothetical protein
MIKINFDVLFKDKDKKKLWTKPPRTLNETVLKVKLLIKVYY